MSINREESLDLRSGIRKEAHGELFGKRSYSGTRVTCVYVTRQEPSRFAQT
jgi:hypothetical protein